MVLADADIQSRCGASTDHWDGTRGRRDLCNVGLWWLVNAEHKTFPAAAWGIALSSRANFLFLIPLAFGWLAQRHGAKMAVRLLLLTCIVCALLTLPFYFYDPQGFAPLEAADRVTRVDEVLPYAAWVIAVVMALLSFILAWRSMRRPSELWLSCALVQAFPVLSGYFHGGGLVYLTYGSFFLCFGILAALTHETMGWVDATVERGDH
jgi:MFS family permease